MAADEGDTHTADGSGTALITGASAGIGRELARTFAREGHDVVLVARREDRLVALGEELRTTHDVDVTVVPTDLAEPDAARDLYERVTDHAIDVSILVNNAGVGVYGPFADSDPEAQRGLLRVNVVALTELTRLFLADVRDGGGKVLNVASMASFPPGPQLSTYNASKAYVRVFTESIAAECRDSGVDVTALCPGPVDTEFQERAGMGDSSIGAVTSSDPATVARAGYDGLMAGETLVIPGLPMKLLYYASKVAPRFVQRRVLARVNADR